MSKPWSLVKTGLRNNSRVFKPSITQHRRQKTALMSVYHWVAGKAGLQFEDFVETNCFSLGEFLFRHANHKLDCGVCVVFLVVTDEGWCFVSALQHGLQHRFLIGLHAGGEKQTMQILFTVTNIPCKISDREEAKLYLCPCSNRKLCDFNGIPVNDWNLSADQVLILAQFMDHSSEVFVAGKLFGDNKE